MVLRVLLVGGLVGACGDDSSAVPFESIPKDKKLIDLNSDEQAGACQWAEGVARQKLASAQPSPGCSLQGFDSCMYPSPSQVACTATVGQWETCLPNFVDHVIKDPCAVIGLALSQSEADTFMNETPGCEGMAPCIVTSVGP